MLVPFLAGPRLDPVRGLKDPDIDRLLGPGPEHDPVDDVAFLPPPTIEELQSHGVDTVHIDSSHTPL